MIFAREPLTLDLLDEADALTRAHWAEVSAYPDIPLDVDRDSYLAAEANGQVRCYTARDTVWIAPSAVSVDHLIGYAIFFVRNNLHYRSSLQATQDVLYLHPSVRGSGDGLKFLAFCDDQLRADGVQVVYHHKKVEHPALGYALRKIGYSPVEEIWAKRLDLVEFSELMAERTGLNDIGL